MGQGEDAGLDLVAGALARAGLRVKVLAVGSQGGLAAARRGDHLRVVDDQTGCPTSARLLAELTGQILAQARAAERPVDWLASRSGVYHAVSAGCCTWYDFARELLERTGLGDVAVEPVSTAEYGARAPRPARTVLDCTKLEDTFGLALPGWREHLRQVVAEGLA